jgi:hypothetical protein
MRARYEPEQQDFAETMQVVDALESILTAPRNAALLSEAKKRLQPR